MSTEDRRVNLLVFFDRDSAQYVRRVVDDLTEAFPALSVAVGEEINPTAEAFEVRTGQLDGDRLLSQLRHAHGAGLALWLVSGDCFHAGLNFVFGLAAGREALVSVFRLDSPELVGKEAIHEVGHIVGLGHCRYTCVMRFSNSLAEARQKPRHFCTRCRQRIAGR